MAELYKHSGAVTLTGTLMGLVAGGVAAVALAFVYTYAVVWIPFIYVNFLLTLIFGVGVGFAVAAGAKAGKLRNMAVAGLLGAFCGLLGLYVAWAIHPMAQFSLTPEFDPSKLMEYMGAVYEKGTWGISRSGPVSGILLGIIWAVEAGIIVLGAALVPPGRLGDLAFCEPCDVWTRVQTGVRTISLAGVDPILARIGEGDVAALRETKPSDAADAGYVRVDLSTCPNCANSAYLTLTLVQKKVDEKGKESTEEKAVLQNLVLAAADVGIVKEPAPR
ncbi:MAG TPA: hypothetical protein VF950_20285 [Planctomycetota bacterium]